MFLIVKQYEYGSAGMWVSMSGYEWVWVWECGYVWVENGNEGKYE